LENHVRGRKPRSLGRKGLDTQGGREMSNALSRIVPKRIRRKHGKHVKKYLSPVKSAACWIFRWRVFWLLVFSFICATIWYPPVGERFVDFMARREPPLNDLPADAKLDLETTIAYKKEKIIIVRTNLKNVALIVGSSLGLGDAATRKLASVSTTMPVTSSIEKIYVPQDENKPDLTAVEIVKDNLYDAFKAYMDLMAVQIVTIDNKPVLVDDEGRIVPYDKTDKILRWARLIEEAANKYEVDPAIIAAIIEQESGGNSEAVSRAGAIGLMQLMPGTARGLGVDPYDPAQNIDGGTRYFLYQYRTFGSIELACAAYNAGPNNVRNGRYLYIPETRGYMSNVPRLVEKYRKVFEAKQ